jgi:hypothetical protein
VSRSVALAPSGGPAWRVARVSAKMLPMKRALICAILTISACGDDGGSDATTNGDTQDTSGDDADSSSATDPTVDDGSSGATLDDDGSSGGSSEEGSTSSADSSGTADASSSDSATGNPVELEVELSDAMAFMSCKPVVPPDPLFVSVTLFFDNPGEGIGTADVTAARLSSGGVEEVSFDLMPASFGPFDPGDMTTADAMKVDGSAMPQEGCETVQCGGDYDLEIVFDVEGTEIVGTATVTVMCGL